MSNHLGLGVMLGILGGNAETVNAVKSVLGKYISIIELKDDELYLTMRDDTKVRLYDDGQSCCENRYMRTDDNLGSFVGSLLTDIEVVSAPNGKCEYGEHEVQFLRLITNGGVITMASHNEHNGYYGGFNIVARAI